MREGVVAEEVAFLRPGGEDLGAAFGVHVLAGDEAGGLYAVAAERRPDRHVALQARHERRVGEVEVVDRDGDPWRALRSARRLGSCEEQARRAQHRAAAERGDHDALSPARLAATSLPMPWNTALNCASVGEPPRV